MTGKLHKWVGVLAVAMELVFTVPALAQTQESDGKNQEMTDSSTGQPAQQQPESTSANSVPAAKGGLPGQLVKDFAGDQVALWTSPKNLRLSDLPWIVPVSGLMAGMLVTDADFSRHSISQNLTTQSHYNTLSNYLVYGMVGGAGAMWLLSYHNHNSHWRETGFLAGEAAIDSLVMTEAFKYAFRRDRPYQDNGNGDFFQSGGTSFPSEHSTVAWSIASVIAHEYPSTLTKILAYSAAGLVSYARLGAHKHFPSDVFAGALVGQLSGYTVYSRHHDPELPGEIWPSWGDQMRESTEKSNGAGNYGSPYVPLDSWVYPVFERLAAIGYVRTGIFGMRPWTRMECKRLSDEANDLLEADNNPQPDAQALVKRLEREFTVEGESLERGENSNAQLESAYTRTTGIAGQPMTDGYYFGQTLLNDFGRPYSEGVNQIVGGSGWATEGPLAVYVRGEYQYAPSIPALPLAAREFFTSAYNGSLPLQPATVTPSVSQFQLLDAYVSFTLRNWQMSFGQQSMWWGPSAGGPMMFSDNATPVPMFRINRVSPIRFPWIFALFGPTRMEIYLGRLAGQQFIFGESSGLLGQWGRSLTDQPFFVGEKLEFKPTVNFEFGVSFTQVTAGEGIPFTFHQWMLANVWGPAVGAKPGALPQAPGDAGDAYSGVDFTYKLPGLRKWATLYGEAVSTDEFSPLGYPRKSIYQGGIYLPRIPGIQKLDLRIEGGSSNTPDFGTCVGCFYYNDRYKVSYTNNGNLMGSWLGRSGQGVQAWSTYWLSPRNTIQFHYRHQKAVGDFVPEGGTINDAGVSANVWLKANLEISGLVQYEKWNYPILAPGPQTNVTSSLGITFMPVGGHQQP
jgi:membrane-associated phospholipid phosphatase